MLDERRSRNRIHNLLKLNNIMSDEYNEYGENAINDMMINYDYHINTEDLPELFDESVIDGFIANLDDWD